jgi:hypothetical protein
MAYRWRVIAVTAQEAQDIGTGTFEPFAAVEQDGEQLILCKGFVEDWGDKASERGGNGDSS